MERIIVTAIFATAMGLFAEGNAPTNDFPWANMTALTALVAALGYIVSKMLPDIHQKFQDSAKMQVESAERQAQLFSSAMRDTQGKFADTLDKIHDRGTAAAKETADELTKLRENCAAACAERRKDG